MKLTHNSKLTKRAQNLRRDATPQERRLWYDFLSSYPVRFRRQVAIDNYILDFYCASAKLAIELDGSQHYETDGLEHDRKRDSLLSEYGIRVLRFSNTDINIHFDAVCEYIDNAIKNPDYIYTNPLT